MISTTKPRTELKALLERIEDFKRSGTGPPSDFYRATAMDCLCMLPEVARQRDDLLATIKQLREILTQSTLRCNHPPDGGGDMCDGEDCVYCACVLATDSAIARAENFV